MNRHKTGLNPNSLQTPDEIPIMFLHKTQRFFFESFTTLYQIKYSIFTSNKGLYKEYS